MGFEIDLQNKRYVTTEGLLYLMGDQYKKYSVRPEIPTVDEVMQIRQMMGLDTGDPLVVIRGVVETDRGAFVDYGTTSPKNLKGFVKFSDYPLEMACRRATNRAMRIATGAGTSIDEIDTEVEPQQQPEVVDTKPATNGQPNQKERMATDQRKAAIRSKLSELESEGKTPEDDYRNKINELKNPMTEKRAAQLEQFIASLLKPQEDAPKPEEQPAPEISNDPLATEHQRTELLQRAGVFVSDGNLDGGQAQTIIDECDKEMYLARFKKVDDNARWYSLGS